MCPIICFRIIWNFYPMDTDELMLLTARNHPLADKLKVNLTDIKDENYIYSEDGFDFEAGGIFEQNDIHPTVLYQLDDDVAVQKMVSDGMGISVLPKLLLSNPPFDICIRPFTDALQTDIGRGISERQRIGSGDRSVLGICKRMEIK